MTISRPTALAAALALATCGCTLLFDPDRLDYRDDAGAQQDAGERGDAGGPMDGGLDGGPSDGGASDGGPSDGGTDAGPPSCGQLGETCCAPPRPACAAGANCSHEGSCEPCGGPGQECCATGAPCQVLTCLGATGRCPPVTPLVQVAVPGGGTYGIDAYEVSRAQYQAWLDTDPTPGGALLAEGCTWNLDFTPNAACVAAGYGCTGAGCGQHPQNCVDWCDAFAYCAAVGKQLCGKYDTGSLSPDWFDDPTRSAWYNACSSGGMHLFSPGDASSTVPLDQACRFVGWGSAAPVGSLAECVSPVPGYEGVYALTGNVREWIHACESNAPGAYCHAVGGAFVDDTFTVGQCNYPSRFRRNEGNASTGFRCCELP